MSSPQDQIEAYEDAEHDVDRLKETFLRERGWKFTCETPFSFWMWEKTLADGVRVLVDRPNAILIEELLVEEEAKEDEKSCP